MLRGPLGGEVGLGDGLPGCYSGQGAGDPSWWGAEGQDRGLGSRCGMGMGNPCPGSGVATGRLVTEQLPIHQAGLCMKGRLQGAQSRLGTSKDTLEPPIR